MDKRSSVVPAETSLAMTAARRAARKDKVHAQQLTYCNIQCIHVYKILQMCCENLYTLHILNTAEKRGRQDSGAGKPAKKKKPEGHIIRTVRPTTPPAADPVEESPAEEPPAADPVEHSSMNSLDTPISSVPPLPSPIKLLDNESLPRIESDESIDPLSLEMEVQDLVDRVVTLETGQEAILQAQKSILQKQNEIMSRLSAIENQLKAPTLPRSYLPFIPPPPSHAPPMLNDYSYDDYSFNENSFNDTSLRPPVRSRGFSPPAYVPPRHAVYSQDEHQHGESMSSEAANPNPRIPFRPLQQNNYTPGDVHGQVIQRKKKSAVGTFPSSTINKDKLIPVSNVFQKYPKLLCESKVGTLAVKLAKDALFGEVMVQCTIAGERDLPGLPAEELRQLKHALYMQFRQYWESPQEFELWKISTEAIGQACKRLRSKK